METAMKKQGVIGRLLSSAAAALATFGLAAGAGAQDLLPVAPEQEGGVILVGGTVHTVSGEVIERGAVGFRDGRITLVADASIMQTIQLTPDTEVIDVGGHRVYPGLIAADTRIGLTETSSVRATNDMNEIGPYTPEVRANVAINPDSTLIPVTRLNGVLLAGVSPTGGRIPGRASVVRMTGWTWEDMTVVGDAGLVMNWPGVRASAGMWRTEPEGDAVRRVERSLDEVGRFFDAASSYAAAAEAGVDQAADLRLASMARYVSGEQSGRGRVFIAADDYDQIVSAVRFAADRDLRAVIVGGRDAPMCAELLKDHGVPVIVDGTHRFPKRADSPHDAAYTLPARLHAAGVEFCLSGAERDGNVRNLANEAAMAMRFGLDEHEAVRSITLSAAEILGVDADYGSLDRGKSATLIVTDGDVLEVTSNVTHAFIDGRSIDMRSKQTDLRDKFVEKYRQLGIIED